MKPTKLRHISTAHCDRLTTDNEAGTVKHYPSSHDWTFPADRHQAIHLSPEPVEAVAVGEAVAAGPETVVGRPEAVVAASERLLVGLGQRVGLAVAAEEAVGADVGGEGAVGAGALTAGGALRWRGRAVTDCCAIYIERERDR